MKGFGRHISKLLARAGAAVLCVAMMISSVAATADAQLPAIERLVSMPTLSGTPPSQPAWSPDSTTVAFLWNDEGFAFRDLWLSTGAGAPRRLTSMRPTQEKPHGTFGEQPGHDLSLAALGKMAAARVDAGISEWLWSPDGEKIWFIFRGDLYKIATAGGEPERITHDGGKGRLAFSPDGRFLSYLRGGDLWLLRFEGNYLARATNVGKPSIAAMPIGAFLHRDVEYRRYSWSPDSQFIALEYNDRRNVRRMPVPSYLHDEPIMHEVRRGYPGDSEEIRRVGILALADGLVRYLELPDPRYRTILTLEWSPVASQLLVQQDSYDGERRWLYVAGAQDLGVREIFSDHRPRRIYANTTAAWSSDGRQIFFVGDADDYYRLYSVPAAGGRPRILTRGNFDVVGIGFGSAMVRISPATREIFFVSAEHSPYERHVYRMPEAGGTPVRVTTAPGIHDQASVAPDGRRVAVVSSSDTSPGELYVIDARGGSPPPGPITHSPLPEFEALPLVAARYVRFPSRIDDFTLHARIIEPLNLDPAKKYPVILSDVYSSTARNQWTWPSPVSLVHQKLVTDDEYIIVQVDLRGSSGYGVDFREAFQGDWGGGDLEDLHSTVDYLKTLPYVDPDRIGLWGNSYGGMMVLFALFERPGMFAAGISGAPAIDVRHFTQNDMHLSRRPWTHPEIFRNSTLLNYGEQLADPLMFIHGLHDDIVPFKTTVAMMEKLILLGKDFDTVIPPESDHWWGNHERYAVHSFRKFMQFFDRHLGAGGR